MLTSSAPIYFHCPVHYSAVEIKTFNLLSNTKYYIMQNICYKQLLLLIHKRVRMPLDMIDF